MDDLEICELDKGFAVYTDGEIRTVMTQTELFKLIEGKLKND